jgi:aspartate carbamoyltransferase catalytic subunit
MTFVKGAEQKILKKYCSKIQAKILLSFRSYRLQRSAIAKTCVIYFRKFMHVVSISQFTPEQLSPLFERADRLRAICMDKNKRKILAEKHMEKQMCSLFYEPSTRTRLSFETAALKMGMGVVSTENARDFSSAAKGETIEDTMRVLNGYDFDVIVIRHHETGAVKVAAEYSKAPVINAGDGKGEHPTQSLLDAYTIHRKFGTLEGLNIVMGGDLANGRTVRSLAQLMSQFKGNNFTFVSIPELQMGEDIKKKIKKAGADFHETDDINTAVKDAHVVYWTRLQKERLTNPTYIPKGGFVIDPDVMKKLYKDAIVMHPLPRVDEIHVDVDHDPRAHYFTQAGNGLYVRMALIDQILEEA